MSNVSDLVEQHADRCVMEMKKILMSNRKRATGQLVNSINYTLTDNILTFKFKGYGNFIQSGRKVGSRMPPVNAILAWMKVIS